MRVLIATLLIAAVLAFAGYANATETTVSASTHTSAQINAIIAGLQPGDILSLLPGLYANVALQVNVKGNANGWITIRGIADAAGNLPVLTINTDVVRKPNIDLGSGSCFVNIQGLTVSQTGSRVYAGIKFHTGNNNIIVQLCNVLNINGNGIDGLNLSNLLNIVIRANVVANVGLKLTNKLQVGAGIVFGGLTDFVKNVLNVRIVDNLIHDIFGFEGAAIKVVLGVDGLQVLDNVVFNAPLGFANGNKSAIYVVTGLNGALVARNLIQGSGLGVHLGVNIGLYVGVGTNVVNNIITQAQVGLQVGLGLNVDLNLGGLLNGLLGGLLGGLGKREADIRALNLGELVTNIVHNTIAGVSEVAFKVVDTLEETLEGLLGDVLGNLNVLNNVFSLLDGVEGIVGAVFELVEELLEAVLGALGGASFLNNVVESVNGLLGGLLDDLLGGLLGPDGLLGGLLGGLGLGKRNEMIAAHKASLRERGLLGGLLDGVLGGLLDNLLSGDGILGFVTGLVDDLFQGGGLLGDLTDLLPIGDLLNTVTDALDKVVNQVQQLVEDLLEDVQALLNDLLADLQVVLERLLALDVEGALDALTNDLLNNLLDNVDTTVQNLLDNLNPTLEEVLNLVDALLVSLTKGLDFNKNVRLGERFSIGALQATSDKRAFVSKNLHGFQFPAAM